MTSDKVTQEQTYLDEFSDRLFSLEDKIRMVKKAPWKKGVYVKQSWPNWLHHMAPYAGRMTPQIAHWLIRAFSNKREVILDPFCGIGTVPLEANLLGRNSVGFDLNPYAYLVANAKMDRKSLSEHIEFLENLELKPNSRIIQTVPKWVHEFYNKKTLAELLVLLDVLKRKKKRFILGCLLGVSQGHRIGHLSKASALTLPYKPRADDPGHYKEVIPRLINKVKRMYKDGFTMEPAGKIQKVDTRKMPLKDNSIDCVISSPPYLDNLDYVNANRLRLALLGCFGDKASKLSKKLMYKEEPYMKMMTQTCQEISRVLKPEGLCILILGDVHTKKNPIITTNLIKKILDDANLKLIEEFPDSIPFNRSVQRTSNMENASLPHRMDRIMIMSNGK